MSFLNPALLGLLVPLVGVPFLIHFLNRKFPKTFAFSSIALIKKSIAQRSRLFRLRHLLLAILRTLAVAALILMFLKPVREMFGSNQHEHGPRHVVVLFDHSLSMEYRDAGVSGRKRGVIEAEKIINTLGADDLVNVIAVERNPAPCLPDFSSNQSEMLSFLYKLPPGLGSADFNKAVQLTADLLNRGQGRQEIYVISDFQRTSWATADLTRLPDSARLFFVNVAPDARPNHGIVGARIKQPSALAGETVTLEVTIGNFAGEAFRGKVEARLDGKTGFETEAAVAPWTTATAELAVRLGTPGLHTLEINLPEDDLPQDDHFFLTTSALEKENVMVVSDENGGQKHSAYFLSTALDPFEGQAGSIRARPLNSALLSGAELSATRKLFLTSLDPLDDPACQSLARFINEGGSAVYFLDGKYDAENLVKIDRAAGGTLVPLRLESKQTGRNIPGGAQQILRGDFKSKYLRLFRGSQRGNLALLQFYEYYHAAATGRGNVLLTYADGSPAMAVANAGLGTLLLCNFSVNELASNVARQRAFPAWIQDLVKTLGNEENADTAHEIGDDIQADIWKTEMPDHSVRAPSGQATRTDRELDVNRYRISFSTNEQGIYRLTEADTPYAWAVNCPPGESDLRSVDPAMLQERLGHEQQAHFVDGKEAYEALHTGRPLFQYFAFGLLALLAVELGLFSLFKRLAA